MNPLFDSWFKVWDKLTGRRYRYRPDPIWQIMDRDTQRFISYIYLYRIFEYRQAIDLLERGRLEPQFRYRHFKQGKTDGTFRHLAEPDDNLKQIQKRLVRSYLRNAQIHRCATGYRRKMSVADHVYPHIGAKIIITADIKDFFPSTSKERVYQWWWEQFEADNPAKLATILTTYKGNLPQGAPTSPALSNVVNYEMDRRLARRIERTGGVYTRYVDDMVFSWKENHRLPADFRTAIGSILHEFGYSLHPDKWCEYTAKDEPQITGVVLRKYGTVTISDEMQAIIQDLEKHDPHSQQLAGYYGFRKMIEER